ncbi:hypothetical protein AMECASPLE_003376 [Ameca splendens]|uniref:Uncharacterized protein n=1 Tax=Ameca splendens TaxID=208324 RepID=A0ABV0Y9G7_9TELE
MAENARRPGGVQQRANGPIFSKQVVQHLCAREFLQPQLVLDDGFIADSRSSLFPVLCIGAESFSGTQYRTVPAHFHPSIGESGRIHILLMTTAISQRSVLINGVISVSLIE